MIRYLTAAGVLSLTLLASPALAGFRTVDLDSYVNGNVAINPDHLPIGLSVAGGASFYALLNNYYGTPGADEYDITIATATQSVTYQSIGGVDTRDYNANVFTNTISNTTTEWFNNGIGQRYDVREFTLPSAFAADTITSFTITQAHSGDNAIFAGLTFSSDAPVTFGVPEPASWAMLVVGFAGAGAVLRRRRKTLVTAG